MTRMSESKQFQLRLRWGGVAEIGWESVCLLSGARTRKQTEGEAELRPCRFNTETLSKLFSHLSR
jgi:hypothetical protein